MFFLPLRLYTFQSFSHRFCRQETFLHSKLQPLFDLFYEWPCTPEFNNYAFKLRSGLREGSTSNGITGKDGNVNGTVLVLKRALKVINGAGPSNGCLMQPLVTAGCKNYGRELTSQL